MTQPTASKHVCVGLQDMGLDLLWNNLAETTSDIECAKLWKWSLMTLVMTSDQTSHCHSVSVTFCNNEALQLSSRVWRQNIPSANCASKDVHSCKHGANEKFSSCERDLSRCCRCQVSNAITDRIWLVCKNSYKLISLCLTASSLECWLL